MPPTQLSFIVKSDAINNSCLTPIIYHPKYEELEQLNKHPALSSLVKDNEIISGKSVSKVSKKAKIGYLKVGNVKPYKPLYSKMSYIDEENVAEQNLSLLEENDVLISRVGTVGNVCLFYGNPTPCTFSDNVLKFTPENINPQYLVAFLNSRCGLLQIERVIRGALQDVINTTTFGSIRVPVPKNPQDAERIGKEFFVAYEQSIELEKQAVELEESLTFFVLKKLGFQIPKNSSALTYITNKENIVDRLDPKFYHPNNRAIRNEIFSKGKVVLNDLCTFPNRALGKVNPEETFQYVDIKSVNRTFGTIGKTKIYKFKDAPDRAKQIIHENDVLLSLTRPTRNAIAIVPHELDGQVCSSGFAILRAKPNVNPKFLLILLRNEVVRLQLYYRTRGAMYPAILTSDLLDISIPTTIDVAADEEKQKPVILEVKQLTESIKQKRRDALKKFGEAKQKVEYEISKII